MADIDLMTSIRSGYLAQLAADAALVNGQPTYSLDGESVSRDTWRQGLMDRIKLLTDMIQAENPFEIQTQAI